jgi:hypothetical protein
MRRTPLLPNNSCASQSRTSLIRRPNRNVTFPALGRLDSWSYGTRRRYVRGHSHLVDLRGLFCGYRYPADAGVFRGCDANQRRNNSTRAGACSDCLADKRGGRSESQARTRAAGRDSCSRGWRRCARSRFPIGRVRRLPKLELRVPPRRSRRRSHRTDPVRVIAAHVNRRQIGQHPPTR